MGLCEGKDLLSVCILTHNRKDLLKGMLLSIKEMNREKFKIIVADNASSDGTREMMEDFAKDDEIIYFRNERNLGFDGNCIKCIEEAKKYSRYSLWIGDDDRIESDFFLDIPRILKKNHPTLIVLNYFYGSGNNKGKVYADIDDDYLENDLWRAFDTWYFKYGAMWANLVVDNSFLNIPEMMKYYGYGSIFFNIAIEMLTKTYRKFGIAKCYFTSKAYVTEGIGVKHHHEPRVRRAECWAAGIAWAMFPQELRLHARLALESNILWEVYNGYENIVWEGYVNTLLIQGENINHVMPISIGDLDYNNDFFSEVLKSFQRKFVMFGAGEFSKKCLKLFGRNKNMIKYILDNNKDKHGTTLMGIPIVSTEMLTKEKENVYIVIATDMDKIRDIRRQLGNMRMNMDAEIMSLYEFGRKLLYAIK